MCPGFAKRLPRFGVLWAVFTPSRARGLGQPSSIHAQHPASTQDGQTNGHVDAVADDVELAAADLVPLDGNLCDLNARAAANDGAVRAQDGGRRGGLGQHEHLNVENPAFGVHIGHNVGEGGAREELEAALSVANARGGGRGEDGENEVKGAHEEVSQGRTL